VEVAAVVAAVWEADADVIATAAERADTFRVTVRKAAREEIRETIASAMLAAVLVTFLVTVLSRVPVVVVAVAVRRTTRTTDSRPLRFQTPSPPSSKTCSSLGKE